MVWRGVPGALARDARANADLSLVLALGYEPGLSGPEWDKELDVFPLASWAPDGLSPARLATAAGSLVTYTTCPTTYLPLVFE